MIDQLTSIFITLLVVIDPIGIVPIFFALTRGGSVSYRRRMAYKGIALATAILLFFVFSGDALLHFLGISLSAFKIAGGALLFLLAIDMVFARQLGLHATTVREQEQAQYKEDISVFPVAFPLLAGPGALTTILLTTTGTRHDLLLFAATLGVLLGVLLMALFCLLLAPWLMKLLGETGASVVDRLSGLILAALATQFMVEGIRTSFFNN
jgi:multiple antibiotic resistance protein